ncbi:hybrid sensor histidine kinase/response regulator [Aureibacter tunicatorum]|uniref:histidine kinase n=1 Tax=Aureibacter tunicatorum TaxID=866807 RepID=A0AAE3XNK6_9BACT|nr:response regulator [Aureibacter tunicatorum]MDR6239175.1 signal transduction histidine kinase [Aureibacter tunicatorum]BDD04899.1 hybrid sensor histidine kinase/response regulator [Aureibacter tunicatorum]
MNTNSTPKILIIDDISQNVQIAANILKDDNYNITYALSGRMALEKMKRISIDLILLDIMMPDMNGFELCSILKANPETSEIPIIFLTAKADIDNISKGFSLGAVDYITKPFNGNELRARVKTHLNLKQAKESLEQANFFKNQLLSIIGHDLRGLVGNTNTLFQMAELTFEKSPEKAKKFLSLGKESAANILVTLENLLEWGRIDNLDSNFDLRKNNILESINCCVVLLKNIAKNKNINIIVKQNCESDFALFDKRMIDTVIRNLIANAIKFSKEDSEIHLTVKDQESYLEVTVKDYGIGMTESKLSQINDFGKAATSEDGTSGEVGFGLGMQIVNKFLEQHDTKLKVTSQLDQGTSCIFKLQKATHMHQQLL